MTSIRSLRVAAALLLALPTLAVVAQAAKPRIERAADLPRFTYKISGSLDELVRSPERLAPLIAQLRRDTQSVVDGYDIPDKSTQRQLLGTLNLLDYLDGRYDAVIARVAQIRQLEDKPADKLLSGERILVMAQAAKANGPTGPAFQAAVGKQLGQDLDPMPFAVVGNTIKSNKAGMSTAGETIFLGQVREVLQPMVDKSGELGAEQLTGLISAHFAVFNILPLKATLLDTYNAYLVAHTTVKPDIWAARNVTLESSQIKKPVIIGIWDGGVDTPIYEPRVLHTADGKPAFIAFDKYSNPSQTTLEPIPEAIKPRLPELIAQSKGFSDLTSNIDSPEAAAVKLKISTLKPEEFKPAIEELRLVGNYSHGTHVAGIAVDGNPGARIVVARIEFGHTLLPDPCTTMPQVLKDAAAQKAYVAFLRKSRVRVVNMSWGGNVDAVETDLRECNIGKNDEERKALARKYFEIGKKTLIAAFKSAPEILWVAAAGNSNNDASFIEDMPASISWPNMITVGAVDQAGDEASFTSYGPTVKVDASGYQVESYVPGGTRVAFSGTSMAAPQVTNLAAKLLAVNPTLTPPQLVKIITTTADASEDGRRHLINPKAALSVAESMPGGGK